MILRALFWISVVAVLMPREPDLGFGRPHLAADFVGHSQSAMPCSEDRACGATLDFIERFQIMAVRNLAEVKADIERDKGRRAVALGD